jgi:uncharacterized membrane protein
MKFITILRSFYNSITSSIAFYPSFYAISAVIFGILLKLGEELGTTKLLREYAPLLVINDVDTARNLLTTLIAGGISMLVFSFSMVMLLLSQAASNYSPRVLPNLISERKHQVILGTFMATILFNIITIVGVDPKGNDYQLPAFSVLMGVISAVIALIAFIYFIHSISSSIQINNILKNIFELSRKRLDQLIKEQVKNTPFTDTTDWHVLRTTRCGTIQNISYSYLREIGQEQECRFEVLIFKGSYHLDGEPLIKTEKKLSEKIEGKIFSSFNYQEKELVSDNYILGLKQITEIGIKAMSPGINDPGTALDTLDYITTLLSLRMNKTDTSFVYDDNDRPIIKLRSISFEELIYNVLAPYRNYCKHDVVVMRKLLHMLFTLKYRECIDLSFRDCIDNEAHLLFSDAKANIPNEKDLKILEKTYLEIIKQ